MSMQVSPDKFKYLNRSMGEWFFSLPLFILLLLTLIIGTGEMLHGQLLRLGEKFFGDPATGVQYFLLRAGPTPLDCNPNVDIDAEVKRLMAPAAGSGTDIDALFSDTPVDPVALRQSVLQSVQLCKDKMKMNESIKSHLTPGLKAYRFVETGFFAIFHFGMDNRSLVLQLIVLFASTMTTLRRHHIGLRPAHTVIDCRVQAFSMLVANTLITCSFVSHYRVSLSSGVELDKPWTFYLWILLFGGVALISLFQFFMVPEHAAQDTDSGFVKSVLKAGLVIPLYSYMALSGGIYFLLQRHWSGLSIYINQMLELSGIFLNLALYIWIGMLLKQTRFVDMFLGVLRPWKMSPEALTYFILLSAAFPTAYTGASGIFVIAAGSLIYSEVRRAGGNPQFALAASAMSGSLGVVLRPCLLVVLIAALNKQVTTSQLYYWGGWVFLLTSTLFFIVSQLYRKTKVQIESPSVAICGMIENAKPLIPYVVLLVMVVLIYQFALNTKLDEFTAPVIIPVVMLGLVVFDQWKQKSELKKGRVLEHPSVGMEGAMRFATNETIAHIGALITLMALSLAVGGVVERSGIMEHAPHHFPNIWAAMAFLVVSKVLLGMIMDPFGAVILVSGTLAPIAYAAGINPVHFWMMVLVAFELGYLMPPVAINQLLLRQVVGDEEIDSANEAARNLTFMRRYERWLLPIIVMSIGLVIVAFLPLAYSGH